MIFTRTVRQPFSSLCTELGVVDGRLCVNRPSQWNLLSHVYLAESSVRPCAHRSNVTVSSSKTGDHSNSTFRLVALPYFPFYDLSFILLVQPDSVHTIQDALAHISQPQSVQVGPSGSNEASQQVLIEALPPILVLHLKRFLYDTAARGVVKVGKPVQFGPDLDIPLGAFFFSCFLSRPSWLRLMASWQTSWHLPLDDQHAIHSTACSTITVRPLVAGTTPSTCSTRTGTVALGAAAVAVVKLGCTLTMRR